METVFSGTVGGAMTAMMLGVPAIALSQYVRTRPVDWERAEKWTIAVLELLLERRPEAGSFWNVNFPHPLAAEA